MDKDFYQAGLKIKSEQFETLFSKMVESPGKFFTLSKTE